MKLNKQQITRIRIEMYNMMVFLVGFLAVVTPVPIEARLLGAFLMANGLTNFQWEYRIKRMDKEITELKNKDNKNQNMSD